MNEHTPPTSRRRFLSLAAGASAAAVGGGAVWRTAGSEAASQQLDGESGETADSGADVSLAESRELPASEDVSGRTLVVVELQGGNDGLATLVPRNAGALYDARGELHIPDEELIDFTDDYGWNPNLAGLSGHGVAAVLGLGATSDPDGSHFEMERRWWAGKSDGADLPYTGFFGRLCDQLVVDQPITGLSIGSNASPALRSEHSVTIGISDAQAGWFLTNEDPFFANMRGAMRDMASGTDAPEGLSGEQIAARLAGARQGLSDTMKFGESFALIDQERIEELYPSTNLGHSFGTAAELIRAESGVRIIHLTHGGFDTHSDQRGSHDYLMEQLGDAMGVFLSDLSDSDHANSTLVCTTSEFGRRVTQNGSGTDHGQAGMAMLTGPVVSGVHGEAPSLTNLDDGNLRTTVDFEQYYATLAEQWFGVPSSEVLDGNVAPIDGLIAT